MPVEKVIMTSPFSSKMQDETSTSAATAANNLTILTYFIRNYKSVQFIQKLIRRRIYYLFFIIARHYYI